MAKQERDAMDEAIVKARDQFGDGLSDIARAVGMSRGGVYKRLKKMNMLKEMVGGTVEGVGESPAELPAPGKVKRYIITSAQNNTHVNDKVWKNLLMLADHYEAEIIVGTFSYNQNAFGQMSVKRGTAKHDDKLWYDPKFADYMCDSRRELGNGLVYCGEMNILPTAVDPLSGLESYSQRRSAIFPHAKMAMRSVAIMKNEGVKLNYTTGTITLMNYIQKKAGLKGEFHHVYGALLVEVNSFGNWWVRQLEAQKNGRIQDLKVVVHNGKVTTDNRVEAITWGDIHAACIDEIVPQLAGQMLDELKPKYQFMHDIVEGVSINHHASMNPHDKFKAFLRGYDSVELEMLKTANVLWAYHRDGTKMVVVDSNHDNWLGRWLREHDYRRDPRNAMMFLEGQLETYKALANKDKTFNITEWALKYSVKTKANFAKAIAKVKFLLTDDSFKTCGNGIENGMHGHLGPNGARGTPGNLKDIGRRANTGHTHSAGIFDGLYVAGCSNNLDMGYNKGPSSWSHSHIITYPSGKRCIVTMYASQWRA